MGKEELNAKTPVAPVEMTKDLSCPLLGIFGNDDRAPSPEQVNQHEGELKKHGKPSIPIDNKRAVLSWPRRLKIRTASRHQRLVTSRIEPKARHTRPP
jgi:hypothetical protein